MIGRRGLALGMAALGASEARAQTGFMQGTKEQTVRFAGGSGVTLAGTLLLPMISEMQYVPGVVLIAGSGPTDRDGNNPGVPARIDLLKQIAETLAHAGIATLRYDKRGIGQSTSRPPGSLAEQERFFAWENFVADVQAAHAELLKHDEIKSYATALLGHSEGGLLALATTLAMGSRRPYGLVLASTPGRPLGDIVRDQIARLAPVLSIAAERTMTAIADTGHVPADTPPALQAIFPSYAGPFLQGAFAFDPAKALTDIDAACLLLHGGADSQIVPLGDIQPLLDALAHRSAAGEALVVPAVSHNLKSVSGPTDPGYAGPLAPAIADKLTSWLVPLLGA
ncbi:MAG: alpha/beta hydrolase family protein [Reyranellales bacterium]